MASCFTLFSSQVHPEGKYVVDIDKNIDITKITPSARVALRNDSYVLHLVLPSKVDPLVNLMKVEKVPDSTYDMIGGLDQQIKEIKEVSTVFFSTSKIDDLFAYIFLLVNVGPKILSVTMFTMFFFFF